MEPDECVDCFRTLLRVFIDRSAEAVNIEISKAVGLTKALKIRDPCADAGILVWLQDTGGSDITKAAIAHLAHSASVIIRHSLLAINASPFSMIAKLSSLGSKSSIKDLVNRLR